LKGWRSVWRVFARLLVPRRIPLLPERDPPELESRGQYIGCENQESRCQLPRRWVIDVRGQLPDIMTVSTASKLIPQGVKKIGL
jgi:hypothetical protein